MATLERGRGGVVGRAADGEPLQGGEVEETVTRVGLGLGFGFSESPPWLGVETEGPRRPLVAAGPVMVAV